MGKKDRSEVDKDTAEARARFAEMSFGEKLAHIWRYDKIPIIAVLIGVIFVVTLVHDVRKNLHADDFLHVTLVNGNEAAGELSPLMADFAARYAEELPDASVYLDCSQTIQEDIESMAGAYAPVVLTSELAAGTIDALAMPENLFLEECGSGAFVPLTELWSAETLAELGDAVWYGPDPDTGELRPYGIYGNETALTDELFYDESQNAVIGIAVTSKRQERAGEFLLYLWE